MITLNAFIPVSTDMNAFLILINNVHNWLSVNYLNIEVHKIKRKYRKIANIAE